MALTMRRREAAAGRLEQQPPASPDVTAGEHAGAAAQDFKSEQRAPAKEPVVVDEAGKAEGDVSQPNA